MNRMLSALWLLVALVCARSVLGQEQERISMSRGDLRTLEAPFEIETYTQKEIKMRSGCRIPISRGCHKEFETSYFEFLFGKAGDL